MRFLSCQRHSELLDKKKEVRLVVHGPRIQFEQTERLCSERLCSSSHLNVAIAIMATLIHEILRGLVINSFVLLLSTARADEARCVSSTSLQRRVLDGRQSLRRAQDSPSVIISRRLLLLLLRCAQMRTLQHRAEQAIRGDGLPGCAALFCLAMTEGESDKQRLAHLLLALGHAL